MTVRLSLPFPRSVNNLYVNVPGKGRVKSSAYRRWLSSASSECWGVKTVKGRYHLTITVERPDNRARDLGNLEKCVSDLLVHVAAVEDDHLAETISMAWSDKAPSKDARVHVAVAPYSALAVAA